MTPEARKAAGDWEDYHNEVMRRHRRFGFCILGTIIGLAVLGIVVLHK